MLGVYMSKTKIMYSKVVGGILLVINDSDDICLGRFKL